MIFSTGWPVCLARIWWLMLDQRLELADLDEDIGRVAAEAARALVDHDPAVGQRIALALRAGRQQDGGHVAAMPMQIVLTGARRYCMVS